jgi:hypothetical protein
MERFPSEWNHSVDKKPLNFKEPEHVLIGKGGQHFPIRTCSKLKLAAVAGARL